MYDWVSFAQFVGYIEHGSGLMFELSVQVSGCILCFLKSVFGFWNYYCRYSLSAFRRITCEVYSLNGGWFLIPYRSTCSNCIIFLAD